MNAPTQFVIILLLLNTFALLSTGSMKILIRLTATQGMLLALMPLIMPMSRDFAPILFFCLTVFGIKGLGLPWLLKRTLRRAIKEAQPAPGFGYNLSLLAGVLALIFSLWLERRLPVVAPDFFPFLLFPAAFCTVFTGFVLIAGRMKAVTQIIGYLVAENGIFILSLPLLSAAGGFSLEMLILLDALAAVLVMGIAIDHIRDAFESTDVGRLSMLKDL
ncbi:MAG: hydrogenase-4 component E [Desulfovibrionaceae bacterium]|nr:hydrogenase-4 component E [Desulfovibrionaceae bacterium]